MCEHRKLTLEEVDSIFQYPCKYEGNLSKREIRILRSEVCEYSEALKMANILSHRHLDFCDSASHKQEKKILTNHLRLCNNAIYRGQKNLEKEEVKDYISAVLQTLTPGWRKLHDEMIKTLVDDLGEKIRLLTPKKFSIGTSLAEILQMCVKDQGVEDIEQIKKKLSKDTLEEFELFLKIRDRIIKQSGHIAEANGLDIMW